MKKLIFILLSILSLVSINAQHITGNGTAENPYKLYNGADFDSIRYKGLNNYYELANNITLKDISSFTPLGNSDNPFTGSFDGKGYTIDSLKIRSEIPFTGLFGKVVGSIRNFKLTNPSIITTNSNTEGYIGSACGYLSALKTDSIFVVSAVISSTNDGNLTHDFGGIFGYISSKRIEYCSIDNIVLYHFSPANNIQYAGGFAGYIYDPDSVKQCYANNVDITCTRDIDNTAGGINGIGGFAGLFGGDGIVIKNCYSRGILRQYLNTYQVFGGFIYNAIATNLSTLNCYSTVEMPLGKGYGLIYAGNSSNRNTCYFDSVVCKTTIDGANTPKANGKPTNEMKIQSTFIDWDFTNIWGINSAFNNGYPYLKTIQTPPPPAKPAWPKVYLWKKN